jgi:hypothetical protein
MGVSMFAHTNNAPDRDYDYRVVTGMTNMSRGSSRQVRYVLQFRVRSRQRSPRILHRRKIFRLAAQAFTLCTPFG